MNKFKFFYLFVFVFLVACSSDETDSEKYADDTTIKEAPTLVQKIISATCEHYGSDKIDSKSIAFKFREHTYTYSPSINGLARTRVTKDSTGNIIRDEWKNEEVSRIINEELTPLNDKTKNLYMNSINSVFYFAFLPKSLNDPAVIPELLDTVEIAGEPYHKIQVTFQEEGGGEDHEDIFLYWIHTENNTMDYLAYKYFTEGGGMRFREAINPRSVNGIVFQDYINYKPSKEEQEFSELDKAFNNGELTEVSRIELTDVVVSDVRD